MEIKIDLTKVVKSPNVCDLLDDAEISQIGAKCLSGLNNDKSSRAQWETSYRTAMELALQVVKRKSFPWAGASNVKFPLITKAAINWHAKAYPATISGQSVVRCQVIGPDGEGEKMRRATRVGKHMSYQLLEKSSWEPQTDTSLLALPIMGCVFKKTVFATRTVCSDMVLPQDLVVDYFTSDLQTAIRITHLFKMSPNEMQENYLAGIYREKKEITQDSKTPMQQAKDASQHLISTNEKEVYSLAEQSCWMDLDGDGYQEPYAVTFDENSGYVYRIIPRFFSNDIIRNAQNKILKINAEEYFTKFTFIPSPDGGFYGLGLGMLLGPINESVNTAINQIFDGATMATLGGGFLGRGVKIKGGESTFKPFEWKNVDSTGISLRDNVFPLPVREPAAMLLELVKFLVMEGEQIGGSGDIEMGDIPGQNVKAGTMSIANQNGQKVFKATYKRFWLALKNEFKKIYTLNGIYFAAIKSDAELFGVTAEDYQQDSAGIIPAADPNIVSDDEKRQLATMILQRSSMTTGYDPVLVEMRWLEAFNVDGIEAIYKGPQPQGPSIEQQQLEIDKGKLQAQVMKDQATQQLAVAKLMIEAQKVQAEIVGLQAKAQLDLKEADSKDTGQAIALMDLQIAAKRDHHQSILDTIDMLHTIMGGKNGDGIGVDRGAKDALAGAAAATLPTMAA
jgi:chaperonin GroES